MKDVPEFTVAVAAMEAGRHDEALAAVLAAFERFDRGDHDAPRVFFTLFLWELLLACHAPARTALVMARDAQLQRVLAGDIELPPGGEPPRRRRLDLVVELNALLGDLAATYQLYQRLRDEQPALARSIAWRAAPAILDAGDFALAEQLVPDPLPRLAYVNEIAASMPLYPRRREPPRLSAELSNLMGEVRHRAQALQGLGRAAEAEQLRRAALDGLANDALRELAQAELVEAGAIGRIIAEQQVAFEEQEEADKLSRQPVQPD